MHGQRNIKFYEADINEPHSIVQFQGKATSSVEEVQSILHTILNGGE